MVSYLSSEELKEVIGELNIPYKKVEIRIVEGYCKKLFTEIYTIYAVDSITNKKIAKVIMTKTDTAKDMMIARKKVQLMRLLQNK